MGSAIDDLDVRRRGGLLGSDEMITHWLSCGQSLTPGGPAVSSQVGCEQDCGGGTNRLTKSFGITLGDSDCLSGILDLTSFICNLLMENEREGKQRETQRGGEREGGRGGRVWSN